MHEDSLLKMYKTVVDAQKCPGIRQYKVKKDKQTHHLTLVQLARTQNDEDKWQKDISRIMKKCQKYRRINHKNVQNINDIFISNESSHTCMGIVGQIRLYDLHDFIGDRLHLDEQQLKAAMIDITEGMAVLHRQKITYRNVRLSNVIKSRNGRHFKLAFSTFRQIENLIQTSNDQYTAPEAHRGQGYDESADVWALGMLFIELITGQELEYQGKHKNKHFYENFPDKDLLYRLPNENIRYLISSMLHKNPSERIKISDLQSRLQTLDLTQKDDYQQQIQEPQQPKLYLSLPLYPANPQQSSCQPQKQEQIINTFELDTHRVSIKLDSNKQLMTITAQSKSNPQYKMCISSSYTYRDLPQSFKTRVDSILQLSELIKDVRSSSVELTSSAQLVLGFQQEQQNSFEEETQSDRQQTKPTAETKYDFKADKFQLYQPYQTLQPQKQQQQRQLQLQRQLTTEQKHFHQPNYTSYHQQYSYQDRQYLLTQLVSLQQTAHSALHSKKYAQASSLYEQVIQLHRNIYPEASEIIVWPFYNNYLMTLYESEQYEKCWPICQQLCDSVIRYTRQLGEEIIDLQLGSSELKTIRKQLVVFGYGCLYKTQKDAKQWQAKVKLMGGAEQAKNQQRIILTNNLLYCRIYEGDSKKLQYLSMEMYKLLIQNQQKITASEIVASVTTTKFLFEVDPVGNMQHYLKLLALAVTNIKKNKWGEGNIKFRQVLRCVEYALGYFRGYGMDREVRNVEEWVRENLPDKVGLFCLGS